jgi:murein DD-endopeptidase MepM/ murein hydrolase activator NlpD
MDIKTRFERIRDQLKDFWTEITEWISFLSIYTRKRVMFAVVSFEKLKDILVSVLLTKRGRYSKHFLNISFLMIVSGAIVGGPAIAQYYPTIQKDESGYDESSSADLSVLTLDEVSTTTDISKKTRFDILDYEVVKGDTLGTIAEKFGISIDTIKWANSLKTEKLLPGQTLRIPPVTGIVHKVGPGDTVYSIAKKYKSDAQKIVNFPANDFSDLDTFALSVGQLVYVPDGVEPQAAPVFKTAPVPQFIAGAGGKFQWPTQGIITQYPVSYHMALDIANPNAPPVAAADGGVVSYAGCIHGGYGCHVIINHGDGYQTLYGHLQAYYVEAGVSVGRGQVIGKMGNTGRSTGMHTHFEVRRNGVLLNPLSFLSK